ncbi:TetR/AcrR family transcriptional regulator [Nocardia higoensis]|uniref:TetR/AcrR family transcriptional regulator n=1 Tax=Nocardia higoensis TaxID=228599 RepID=UPI0002F36039|nr:TetR/AcrR family transcriptional regulator [Nocardia higoensis]
MGNREDLLEGARKAILERGLAKVTARDIATAAGVSLAAIGYHFGSKDRLVTEALTEGVGNGIGDRMEAIIRAAGQDRPLRETIGETWDGMVAILGDHREDMLLSMENIVRITRSAESRQYMADASEHAHDDLAATLRETHPDLSAEQARALAKLLFTLFQGIAMLWLAAPTADLLDGDELTLAVDALKHL